MSDNRFTFGKYFEELNFIGICSYQQDANLIITLQMDTFEKNVICVGDCDQSYFVDELQNVQVIPLQGYQNELEKIKKGIIVLHYEETIQLSEIQFKQEYEKQDQQNNKSIFNQNQKKKSGKLQLELEKMHKISLGFNNFYNQFDSYYVDNQLILFFVCSKEIIFYNYNQKKVKKLFKFPKCQICEVVNDVLICLFKNYQDDNQNQEHESQEEQYFYEFSQDQQEFISTQLQVRKYQEHEDLEQEEHRKQQEEFIQKTQFDEINNGNNNNLNTVIQKLGVDKHKKKQQNSSLQENSLQHDKQENNQDNNKINQDENVNESESDYIEESLQSSQSSSYYGNYLDFSQSSFNLIEQLDSQEFSNQSQIGLLYQEQQQGRNGKNLKFQNDDSAIMKYYNSNHFYYLDLRSFLNSYFVNKFIPKFEEKDLKLEKSKVQCVNYKKEVKYFDPVCNSLICYKKKQKDVIVDSCYIYYL
ncbi:hypothetical protein PPERSA_09462 [Pseudocohnilembus persalinus]|uniref:Uncharacterized protein n=1 Tax=Pseudocohnilembus persalinus TaxID=266149 RepID=A0A0V0Q8N7_PSEPJ|nr:hypothetical protein PPERSA_09462 [Pseudocohnilembus persalinus]|eukprot:KRW98604.1 hypothetical protein PPERSA_09462 [Pseudocohnilembus persalinus]